VQLFDTGGIGGGGDGLLPPPPPLQAAMLMQIIENKEISEYFEFMSENVIALYQARLK
jgi:hypothetical protein